MTRFLKYLQIVIPRIVTNIYTFIIYHVSDTHAQTAMADDVPLVETGDSLLKPSTQNRVMLK